MSNQNQHGLSRHIREPVKLKIRQNSNFGCVICRTAIYEFEHFDPDFKDAEKHDPDGIALLCPTCHSLVSKGRIPKSEVAKKYRMVRSKTNPIPPKDHEFFQHYSEKLNIKLGNSLFTGFQSIINLDGKDVLSYSLDKVSKRFVVSGEFYDREGNEIFRIERNEWIGPTDVWDVEQKGRTLTIKKSAKKIIFSATKDNENELLIINELDMFFFPFHLKISSDKLLVGQYSQSKEDCVYFEVEGDFIGGDCAIYLDSGRSKEPQIGQLQIKGGEGAWIEGTGIYFGFGVQKASIRNIKVLNSGCPLLNNPKNVKSLTPAGNQHYFVTGILESKIIQYPRWTKEQYFLNGQSLESKPYSWGIIGYRQGKPIELFYINNGEPEDLTKNNGFIGFHADDVLQKPWADKVFEAEVSEKDEQGNEITRRVKVSEINNHQVIFDRNRPLVPQMFAGCSPWRN